LVLETSDGTSFSFTYLSREKFSRALLNLIVNWKKKCYRKL